MQLDRKRRVGYAGVMALSFWLAAAPAAAQGRGSAMPALDGQVLLTLSDGDMVASAYIDGRLGEKRPDLLGLIPLRGPDAGSPVFLPLSNSVQVWPNNVALTQDGRFAIVTEARKERAEDAELLRDIAPGSKVNLVDLSNPRQPKIVQSIDVEGPTSVDISPDGRLVAVSLLARGEVALIPLENGRLGTPTTVALELPDAPDRTVREFRWHPSGRFAAATFPAAGRIAFYALGGEPGRPALSPWGNSIQTAPLPGKGVWMADGRYFMATVMNLTGAVAQSAYGRNGSLFDVVRFDATEVPDSPPSRGNDGQPQPEIRGVSHVRVASVPSGQGYVENFAVSPDGRWVAGLNMRGSWLPANASGRTRGGSLSLHRFDPETGDLEPVARTDTDATLSQGIAFDAGGRRLVTTSFQFDSPSRRGGALQFWEIGPGARPTIRRMASDLEMPRGTHHLELIR